MAGLILPSIPSPHHSHFAEAVCTAEATGGAEKEGAGLTARKGRGSLQRTESWGLLILETPGVKRGHLKAEDMGSDFQGRAIKVRLVEWGVNGLAMRRPGRCLKSTKGLVFLDSKD